MFGQKEKDKAKGTEQENRPVIPNATHDKVGDRVKRQRRKKRRLSNMDFGPQVSEDGENFSISTSSAADIAESPSPGYRGCRTTKRSPKPKTSSPPLLPRRPHRHDGGGSNPEEENMHFVNESNCRCGLFLPKPSGSRLGLLGIFPSASRTPAAGNNTKYYAKVSPCFLFSLLLVSN